MLRNTFVISVYSFVAVALFGGCDPADLHNGAAFRVGETDETGETGAATGSDDSGGTSGEDPGSDDSGGTSGEDPICAYAPDRSFVQQPFFLGRTVFVPSSEGNATADSFVPPGSGVVTRIHWWGNIGDGLPQSPQFAVKIYADSNGKPGTLVDSYVSYVSYSQTGIHVGCNTQLQQYEFELPQPLALTPETRYWLSVATSESWHWALGASMDAVGAQHRSAYNDWSPINDNDFDVAFQVFVSP